MKRLIPAAFVLLAGLALSQPAHAPTPADHATDFENQANVAELCSQLTAAHPTAHFYFLGRAEAYRAAAAQLRK